MDTQLIQKVTGEYTKKKIPQFRVGDIIEVHTKVKEGNKERIQVFKGLVIAIKGEGASKTFTIRKISYGIGVEKIYPLYSPVIEKIKVLQRGRVKRSKLYYIRERVGKAALKAGTQVPVEGEEDVEEIPVVNEQVDEKKEENENQAQEVKTDSSKETSEKSS